MPWDVGEHTDLFERIDHWKQEVVKNTLQQDYTRQPRWQRSEPHPMKLRSRDARPALAEVSGNPYSRKRKASATMADAPARKSGKSAAKDEQAKEVTQRPRRGRPAKNQQVDVNEAEYMEQPASGRSRSARVAELTKTPELDLQIRPGIPSSIWSPSGSTSPRKAVTSPSKKGQITLDKQISEAAIDMDYLSRCNPAVNLTTFSELRADSHAIPSQVEDLLRILQQVPHGIIPSTLEPEYENDANTPRKSKEPHSKSQYLDPEKIPFPPSCLGRMKSTADNVWGKALRAHSENAQERQWGALVNQLLCEVEIWQKWPEQVVVLNVETCSIQPLEIRPNKPNTKTPIELDAQTLTSDTKTKSSSENVGRMVDWCLGMNVDKDDMKVIRQAYSKTEDHAASLNQSISYIKNHPLILDIEIKKTLQPRDPQVQLAIWASSALLKKRLMGWDTSMPMPALAINGHLWEYYIFFEMEDDLTMAGPYHFGSTATLSGIWTIFYRLHIIMKWGMTEYKAWFKAHVVESARRYYNARLAWPE